MATLKISDMAAASALTGPEQIECVQSAATRYLTPTQIRAFVLAFPASQVPSANANTLDDYEEGTATIGISFGGAAVGVTYTTQALHYTKIGNRVCFEVDLTLSSKGSSVGAALITGLPFTAASGINPAVAVDTISGFTGLVAGLSGSIIAASNTIALQVPNTTGGTALADTNCSNTSTLRIAGSYHV